MDREDAALHWAVPVVVAARRPEDERVPPASAFPRNPSPAGPRTWPPEGPPATRSPPPPAPIDLCLATSFACRDLFESWKSFAIPKTDTPVRPLLRCRFRCQRHTGRRHRPPTPLAKTVQVGHCELYERE